MNTDRDPATLLDELVADILKRDAPIVWTDEVREVRVEDDRSHAAPDDPPFRVIVSVGVETYIIPFDAVRDAAQAFLRAIGPEALLKEFQSEAEQPVFDLPPGVGDVATQAATSTADWEETVAMLKSLRRASPRPPSEPSALAEVIAAALSDGFQLSWLRPDGRPIQAHRYAPPNEKVTYSFWQGRWRRGEGNQRSYPTAILAAQAFIGALGEARALAAVERVRASGSTPQSEQEPRN